MNCQHCQTDVPNADCDYSVDGMVAWIRGHCPECGYRELGRIRLTAEQKDAWYHNMPLRLFRLAKYINTRLWIPEERA